MKCGEAGGLLSFWSWCWPSTNLASGGCAVSECAGALRDWHGLTALFIWVGMGWDGLGLV
jgi:hypothetical protein